MQRPLPGLSTLAGLTLTAVLLVFAAIDVRRHVIESRGLAAEAAAIAERNGPRERALAIAAAVRARIRPSDSDESRPWLRATAWETWQSAQGDCGEAARVIVVMLRSLAIPAARVYLIRADGAYVHVAVAYRDQGKWYLVDTNTSPADFNAFVRDHTRSLPKLARSNGYFTGYSYVNWRRVLPVRAVNQREALPQPLVLLMEDPHLIGALLKTTLASVLMISTILGYILPPPPLPTAQ